MFGEPLIAKPLVGEVSLEARIVCGEEEGELEVASLRAYVIVRAADESSDDSVFDGEPRALCVEGPKVIIFRGGRSPFSETLLVC